MADESSLLMDDRSGIKRGVRVYVRFSGPPMAVQPRLISVLSRKTVILFPSEREEASAYRLRADRMIGPVADSDHMYFEAVCGEPISTLDRCPEKSGNWVCHASNCRSGTVDIKNFELDIIAGKVNQTALVAKCLPPNLEIDR